MDTNASIKIGRVWDSFGILIPKDALALMRMKEYDEIVLEPRTKAIVLILKKSIMCRNHA
jgi:hypothetical protein